MMRNVSFFSIGRSVLIALSVASCRDSSLPLITSTQHLAVATSRTAEEGFSISDDGSGAKVVPLGPVEKRTLTADELDEVALLKPLTADAQTPRAAETPTERVLAKAAARNPSDAIRVVVELEDAPFDASVLRGADEVTRQSIIAGRQAELAPSQAAFETHLAGLGGAEVVRFWDKQ